MSNREDKFTQSAIITPSRHIYKYQIPTAEKFVNFLDEVELISRTNEYRPYDAYEDSRRTDLPVDLRELHVEEFHTLVEEDCYDNIRLMKYDPLRGNHLSIAGYKEDQFYLFSTGDVLSTLVIASSRKKKYDIDDTTVELPLNRLNILYTEDMTRSIKQTVISPFQSSHEVVFGVRTSSSIHIREYNKRSRTMRKIHDYILPEESIGNPFIDYSMPCSLVLSPFDEYQYLISTNNGYTALIDGLNESVLFENKIPEIYDKEYQSRWVSSNFGRGLHSYYIATEKYIKQWSTTNSHVKSKTLVTSKDKIIAFTSTRSDLIAYSTINETKVINVIHPNQPIVSWIHKMGEGAIHISLDDLSDNRWRVVVSSILTQRVDFIEFVYQKDIDVISLDSVDIEYYYSFELSPYYFEKYFRSEDTIEVVGFSFMKNEITRKDGDRFFSFYRQFADGSIKTQYILFSKAKKDRGACSMRCKPKYVLGNNGVISFFQERARLDKLPLVKNPRKELFLVQKGKVDSLLHPFTKIKLMQLDASTEYNIREKLEKLEQPTTAFALLDDHTQYDPDAVISLLKDLEEKELIRLVHIDKISSMIQNNETVDQERHNTLSNFQDYEIILSSWIIHPMPSIDSKLQCLLSIKEIDYTKTTDILGNQWTIDSTDYRQIEFDYLNTDYQLKGDLTFPPWHQSKRNRNTKDNLGSLDNVDHLFFASQPALDRSVESSLPATVVSASQPELPLKESKVKKIKKSGKGKKKVAGFR